MRYEFNPEVELLLVDESDEEVMMEYISETWAMPKIGERPPYYTNPRYEPYYPLM
ncbi:hypothetical protein HUG15_22210 [Salicibibacter cibarius]|uniref:Uncharacterized protein n=1 Tax=Salicibibacter cibarius TaxID=2743000 RepID=A0A7T6Z6R3_9BACI|nr:hypothetical protein [Salicibibacter cibarius]QQK78030.1 hypothetical protein HUG15_22210 [Salicibibacter cibarius]